VMFSLFEISSMSNSESKLKLNDFTIMVVVQKPVPVLDVSLKIHINSEYTKLFFIYFFTVIHRWDHGTYCFASTTEEFPDL
jgi:hypothetical protein